MYKRQDNGQELRTFDYVVSNPPFKMDFSDTRERIAAMPVRFWAGVPKVPAKKKEMCIRDRKYPEQKSYTHLPEQEHF